MATTYQDDNEPFIVEAIFKEVLQEVEAKFGPVNEARARRMLFIIMNDKSSSSFHTSLSRAKTVVHVPEIERARYHSIGVRYFKKIPRKRTTAKVSAKETNWGLISHLCAREQHQLAVDAGEDRLSPDWAPEYTGPTDDDYFVR